MHKWSFIHHKWTVDLFSDFVELQQQCKLSTLQFGIFYFFNLNCFIISIHHLFSWTSLQNQILGTLFFLCMQIYWEDLGGNAWQRRLVRVDHLSRLHVADRSCGRKVIGNCRGGHSQSHWCWGMPLRWRSSPIGPFWLVGEPVPTFILA